MFGMKNHSIQLKYVKDNAIAETEAEKPHIPKEEILDLYDGLLKRSAIAVIAVVGAIAVAKTGSEVIIHHATK